MNSNALFDLTGRVAIVTGGNGGLGKGIALGLASAGADIVIAARNEQKSAGASAEIAALGVKTLTIKTDVTVEGINSALMSAADERMKGILEFTMDPIVSSDVVGNPHSSVIDGRSTLVMDKRMVKVVSWYDNEWGYSNRVCDLIRQASAL